MTGTEELSWTADGHEHHAQWRSGAGHAPPARLQIVDDTLNALKAWQLACEGTSLLWQGDFQNARQLLSAMTRRADRRRRPVPLELGASERFHLHRQAQAQRARTLGRLLVPLGVDYHIALRRAPDVRAACEAAWGRGRAPVIVSLRELLGVIGAHQWQLKGVEVPALGARIHPWHGVFSPLRGEYVDLVARAPLPATTLAFDIGTGSGVIAAMLARRGLERVVATDVSDRALACAADNLRRLGLDERVDLLQADLFPPGRAPLVVCNPPWLPARPTSAVEGAIYDPDGSMLRGFLAGLAAHLEPGGEGWLILSDLAEHLGLRSRDELLSAFRAAGLTVVARLDTRARHRKAGDEDDPLHTARAAEITSLWRLAAA